MANFLDYVKGKRQAPRENTLQSDIDLKKQKKRSTVTVSEKSKNLEIFKFYLKVERCSEHAL